MSEQLDSLRKRLDNAAKYLHLDELAGRQTELEKEAARGDLWDDPVAARQITQELASVMDSLNLHNRLEQELSDLEVLSSLIEEEAATADQKDTNQKSTNQKDMAELQDSISQLGLDLDQLEMRSLLSGEYDHSDAVCRIKSGAGGNDAQDWAEMLFRMYMRWAERSDFKVELNSIQPAEGGGITSAEFVIRGVYAYGNLQGEHGVHRLVRISPYSKEGKRETSFASMSVVPLLEDLEETIDIQEKELRIDTYRSSGAGGQHVNVTDSAVRITHLPTGLVTSCQAERSQHQNKERAMQMLVARLLDLKHRERMAEITEITGDSDQVDFGSQIRSYVLHPYQMVKDLRTQHETGRIDDVFDGDLNDFIQAHLRWLRQK